MARKREPLRQLDCTPLQFETATPKTDTQGPYLWYDVLDRAIPVHAKHLPNIDVLLGQSRRGWSNITATLG